MDKMDNKDNMDQNRCQNKQTRRIISLDVGIAWITRIIRIFKDNRDSMDNKDNMDQNICCNKHG